MPDNTDIPSAREQDVETFYYVLHNASYNVMMIVSGGGGIHERYEYTPYGQRQVFATGTSDPVGTPRLISRDFWVGGVVQPYPTNPFGHQGLHHDEEIGSGGGLIYNRARMLHPRLGRFMQRDPLGYVDGMSVYAYYAGMRGAVDPTGTELYVKKMPHGDKILDILKILAPDAKEEDASRMRGWWCIKLEVDNRLSEKLVKSLVDSNRQYKIVGNNDGQGHHRRESGRRSEVTIDPNMSVKALFTNDWNSQIPTVLERAFPDGDKELAAVLAHELIHAYYIGEKRRREAEGIDEAILIANNIKDPNALDGQWGIQFGKPAREELFTTGIRIATKLESTTKTLTVTEFTADYTENKIRRDLGIQWKRISYAGEPRANRSIVDRLKHEIKDFSEWTVVHETLNYDK